MEQENKMQKWVDLYDTSNKKFLIAQKITDNERAVEDWASMQDPERIFQWGSMAETDWSIMHLVEKKFKDMTPDEYHLQMIMDITRDCKFKD